MNSSDTPPAANTEPQTSPAGIDIALLKKEVDALQIESLARKTPWYRNISTLLSVVAMLFSFSTTYVSYVRTQAQDIQNTRIELRGLLQRLAVLPKENIEARTKYSHDPAAAMSISGYLNQENTLLTRQAMELSRKIPTQYISATEYYSIAVSLQAAYYLESAREFYAKAIEVSDNLNDRIASLRGGAHLLFIAGQPDAGRVEYQRALNVFSGLAGISDDFTRKSTHIWTELAWAVSEMNIGMRPMALQHIANAENIALQMMPGPGTNQILSQIRAQKVMFTNPEYSPADPSFADATPPAMR
jgi:hypothetical protein